MVVSKKLSVEDVLYVIEDSIKSLPPGVVAPDFLETFVGTIAAISGKVSMRETANLVSVAAAIVASRDEKLKCPVPESGLVRPTMQ